MSALYRVFLARFFENESTVGRSDLRESFFWLIGMLAAPGMFWAFWQNFRWSYVLMAFGRDALRETALFDKALYLTLTYVAIGYLACAAWTALVIDRRDALILGVLPLRLRAIVAGKLAAVGAYVGLVLAGMHAGSAVLFGTFLSVGALGLTWRAILAHFVAASAMGLFVFLGMAALAAVVLATVGPRWFARLSSHLQIACVLLVTAGLVFLPAIAAAGPSLARGRASESEWIAYAPPIWFLGLYETLAGTPYPVMHDLAATAALTLAAILVVFLAAYPIACRRVLDSPSPAMATGSRRWSRHLVDGAGRLLSRKSAVRGAAQFTLATFGRIQRHRMALAIGFGLSLTIAMPIVLAWWSPAEGARRRDIVIPLLAAGPTLMFFVAAGVRVALALPSEAAASWIFSTVPSPVWAGRLAARRVMWAFAVVPGAAVAAAAAIAVWEIWPAVLTGAVVALTGAILTDLHLWGFAAVPCARLAAPGSANLQGRWPIYLAGLYLVCVLLPQSLAAARGAGALGWFALGLLPLATIVRVASDRAARVNAIVDDDERQLLLLDLSVQPGERRVPHA